MNLFLFGLINAAHTRRSGNDEDDQTAFLPEDQNFGEKWDERPALLFELRRPDDQSSQKPIEMMVDGKVVLDPYNHPVRDFPGELPVCLSTAISGAEVELYTRRNPEIHPYDLMGESAAC